jgi:hypothetical protein
MRIRLLLGIACILTAGVAEADQREDPPRRSPDFLFGRPSGSIGLRGSWWLARAGSDWYDFVTRHLTLDRGDFDSRGLAADVGIAVTRRLEVVAGVDFSQTTAASEYRDFVDNNRLPITQSTRLRAVNLTGSARFALTNRGHEISRLAWIPRTVTPYVGAGGGMLWYGLEQVGDFVDFTDLSVFADVFRASGWTPSAHVLGGMDVKVYRRLFATFDARYIWAAGELGREWIGFEPIDLGGLRLSAGINVLF